jgi:hypothetical protein
LASVSISESDEARGRGGIRSDVGCGRGWVGKGEMRRETRRGEGRKFLSVGKLATLIISILRKKGGTFHYPLR